MDGNTVLSVLKTQDQWYYVKMDNGISGWAFKRWICRGSSN